MASNRLYGPSGAPGQPALAQNTSGAAAAVLPALTVITTAAETVIPNPSLPGNALVVQIPSRSAVEGKPFEVVASGYINAAAIGNVTIDLYSGTSLVPGNNTLLKSSGAIAYAAAAKNPFYVKATLIYDSTTGLLTGSVKFFINNSLVAEAAVANTIPNISNQNNPVASFCLSATFSVANAANAVNITDFSVNF